MLNISIGRYHSESVIGLPDLRNKIHWLIKSSLMSLVQTVTVLFHSKEDNAICPVSDLTCLKCKISKKVPKHYNKKDWGTVGRSQVRWTIISPAFYWPCFSAYSGKASVNNILSLWKALARSRHLSICTHFSVSLAGHPGGCGLTSLSRHRAPLRCNQHPCAVISTRPRRTPWAEGASPEMRPVKRAL